MKDTTVHLLSSSINVDKFDIFARLWPSFEIYSKSVDGVDCHSILSAQQPSNKNSLLDYRLISLSPVPIYCLSCCCCCCLFVGCIVVDR